MKDILRKLSSRKLWTAICGIIVGIAAAFGLDENEWAQIAGIVTSAISARRQYLTVLAEQICSEQCGIAFKTILILF